MRDRDVAVFFMGGVSLAAPVFWLGMGNGFVGALAIYACLYAASRFVIRRML